MPQATPGVRDSRYIARDLFEYVIPFYPNNNLPAGGLVSGATATGVVNIDTDSDFFWQKGMYFATEADADETLSSEIVPLIGVTIQDTTTGRNLSNDNVPVTSIFGTGSLPFINPIEKYFAARAQIKATITNFSAATTYTRLYLVFSGIKAFL